MSRGPTRRLRRMLDDGAVSRELLQDAEHEADLLAHPYIGLEHVALARLRLAGHERERAEMQARLVNAPRRRWWRPRGPRSALRGRGLDESRSAQHQAQENERKRPG